RYEGRYCCGKGEMLGTEGCERRRVEKRPEQNQLVEAPRLLPITAKKNADEADDKDRSTDRVRPNHGARNHQESHSLPTKFIKASLTLILPCSVVPLSDLILNFLTHSPGWGGGVTSGIVRVALP